MIPEWLFLFAGAVALSAIGFVCVAVIWLRKLHDTVSVALSEAAKQQINTAQRMSDAIAQVQKQQDNYNQQIQMLAQAGLRLQREISNVSSRIGDARAENIRGGQTVH